METLLTESLWGDESFSAMAVKLPFGETMGVVMRDTAPPLFYFVGWIWGRVFGFSEVALRSSSLLLMIGAAVFAYAIVNRIGKDRFVAIGAGFLSFLSPFLVPFAFEFRMYALFAFLVVGSVYFFIARKWRSYVVFTVAALYSHHYALFTVFGQFVWFLVTEFHWKSWRTFPRQLWPFVLIGALYIPWLYPFYLQIARVKGAGFWLQAPGVWEILGTLGRFATGGVPAGFVLPTAFLVGGLLLGKDWKRIGKRWLELFVIFLMPVAVAVGISHVLTPIFYDRYLLSVAIGTVILTTLGIRGRFRAGLFMLLVLYGYVSFTLFTHPTKRPFRELAAYVHSEQLECDFFINYNGRAHHLWESKYYGISAPIYTPAGPLPLYVGTAQMTAEDTVAKLPEQALRLGVITSDPAETIVLPGGFRRAGIKEFGELKVVWFSHL